MIELDSQYPMLDDKNRIANIVMTSTEIDNDKLYRLDKFTNTETLIVIAEEKGILISKNETDIQSIEITTGIVAIPLHSLISLDVQFEGVRGKMFVIGEHRLMGVSYESSKTDA